MTFLEAALEVMRREGRPMHAKEIAERAVALDLLSHVGKTPQQTMATCLSAVVTKGRGKGPVVRTGPSVFGLAEWGGKAPGPSPQAQKEKPAQPQKEPRDKLAQPHKAKPAQPQKAKPAQPLKDRTEQPPRDRPAPAPVARPAPVENVAPQHPAASAEPAGPPNGEEGQGRKRKRRRRKKRSGEPDAVQGPPQPQARIQIAEGVSGRAVPVPPPATAAQGEPRMSEAPKAPEPHREASRDLADQAEALLRSQPRPVPAIQLAETFFGKAGAAGEGDRSRSILVDALLAADGLERESRGLRPRFVQHRSGWALAEREVSTEIVALERQVAEATERLARLAERQVLRKVKTLPMDGFVRVMTVYLRRSGFGVMTPVERGGKDEFHLSVQDRRHGGRFRTAVVLRRNPPEEPLGDRTVTDLRGTLHHYDAMSGLIVTTGSVSERARAEALVPNLPPVALIDGDALAREMVRLGIGVRERRVALPAFDDGFFGALGV
ncbi:MAG: HTH domain-containing protein [Deltaproteobacteria bacterium]|nr:HTH domain-containing protein [Deltaproteobacteria bacterium]